MLVEVYGDTASIYKSCREWFRYFKEISVENKPRSGQPKKFKDKELDALLEEDQNQTQEKLAESLGVQAVSVRLRAMEMIQKQENWVPYELKSRDIKRRFFTCEQLIQREKIFCIGLWLEMRSGDEKDILRQPQEEKILR